MKFPEDKAAKFQMLLMLFLIIALASSFAGAAYFAISVAVLGGACLLYAQGLQKPEQGTARLLVAAFAAFACFAYYAREAASDPLQLLAAFPALIAGFAAFFVVLKLYVIPWKVDCTVLGYSNGLAIVQTRTGIASTLPPGRHVVESRPVKAGAKAVLVLKKSVFGQGTPERLEIIRR